MFLPIFYLAVDIIGHYLGHLENDQHESGKSYLNNSGDILCGKFNFCLLYYTDSFYSNHVMITSLNMVSPFDPSFRGIVKLDMYGHIEQSSKITYIAKICMAAF